MNFPFSDPLLWFQQEFKTAEANHLPEPNAMQLATVNEEGIPSIRTVLFKGLVRGGFSFYTNYQSPKSQDLIRSKKAALNFFWPSMEQQIRIEGLVEKLTRTESENYFKTRARLSQIGAWASEQSKEIPNMEWLDARVNEFEEKFKGKEIPCPQNWGGFHVIPLKIEFWFGKKGRLHQRFVFERKKITDTEWRTLLKSP